MAFHSAAIEKVTRSILARMTSIVGTLQRAAAAAGRHDGFGASARDKHAPADEKAAPAPSARPDDLWR